MSQQVSINSAQNLSSIPPMSHESPSNSQRFRADPNAVAAFASIAAFSAATGLILSGASLEQIVTHDKVGDSVLGGVSLFCFAVSALSFASYCGTVAYQNSSTRQMNRAAEEDRSIQLPTIAVAENRV